MYLFITMICILNLYLRQGTLAFTAPKYFRYISGLKVSDKIHSAEQKHNDINKDSNNNNQSQHSSPHLIDVNSTASINNKSRRREGLGRPKGTMHATYELQRHTLSGLPSAAPYTVLGIETSCDDTGVAIVRSDGTILGHVVLSQYAVHERFGGVVPSLAMESHKANIETAVAAALAQAGMRSVGEVDAVAVTRGPGLEICLRVGLRRALALAREHCKPFVTVHHLEAHCLIARLAGVRITSTPPPAIENNTTVNTTEPALTTTKSSSHAPSSSTTPPPMEFESKVEFPFLVFLASGGHTSLMLCYGVGDFRMLGGTLDDALGEAFDKAARLLGMKTNGGSGGAAVEAAARHGDPSKYISYLTVPMRDKANCDFSYAGMKSSFRLAVVAARAASGLTDQAALASTNAPASQMEESPEPVELPEQATADLCAAFQEVAFSHVEDRLARALDYTEDARVPITALVVVGGVAANMELRRRLLRLVQGRRQQKGSHNAGVDSSSSSSNLPLIFPPVSLCTDNGVMAAWGGVEKLNLGISDAVEEQEVQARWPLAAAIDPAQLVFRRKLSRKERERAEWERSKSKK